MKTATESQPRRRRLIEFLITQCGAAKKSVFNVGEERTNKNVSWKCCPQQTTWIINYFVPFSYRSCSFIICTTQEKKWIWKTHSSRGSRTNENSNNLIWDIFFKLLTTHFSTHSIIRPKQKKFRLAECWMCVRLRIQQVDTTNGKSFLHEFFWWIYQLWWFTQWVRINFTNFHSCLCLSW